MRRIRVSGQRRLMLRFFDEPSSDPYVSITMDVSLEPALEFLEAFEREHAERVGIQHLVTAAVARCLSELPALNVKIVGRAFYQLDSVDIAVPVRLTGDDHSTDQTGMVVLPAVEKRSLLEIAHETRDRSRDERADKGAGSALGRKLMQIAPSTVEAAVDLAAGAISHPLGYRLLGPWGSVSTAVTNVGAVFRLPEGARFRSVSMTIPTRLSHVASAFALAPACDAPVAEKGRVVVRRVLPIMMVVDHRAIDGYLMAKLGERLVEALLEPAALARSGKGRPRAT